MLALGVIGTASAQSRPADAGDGSAAPGAETGNTLQNVTVTARKWSERLLETPISMSVQTGEALRKAGIQDVNTALSQVPGVTSLDGGANMLISIRGISADLGANAAGYYLDDLPFSGVTTSIAPDTRSWDLNRVEVLRGPQGTLFGEGSMGGTVRITTNNARLREFGFAGQLGLSKVSDGGSGNGEKVMLNVPIGEKVAIRFAGTHEVVGGWLDDSLTGEKDVNRRKIDTARLRVHFEPTDRLSLNFSHWTYSGDFGKGNTGRDDGTIALSLGLGIKQKWDVTGFSASYDFDTVNIYYGFARNNFESPLEGPLYGGTSTISVDIKPVTSHELRATSTGSGPLKWTAGVYKRDADRRDGLLLVSPIINLDNVSATQSRTTSIFGEASYTLPRIPVELTAGLRHFRDSQSNQDSNAGVLAASAQKDFSSTNPRFSIAYKPQRDTMYFASASKGFRSGIFQPSPSIALGSLFGIALPAALTPDSVWTYELGTKQALLDGRMAFEASIYHSDWKNMPVRIPIGTTGVNGLINSPGAKINGIEVSTAWEASRTLNFTLAGAYTQARWVADVPGTNMKEGQQVNEVPKFQLNAAANWRLPSVAGWAPTARLAVNHNSLRDSHVQAISQPGDPITIVDARVAFERGPWTASFYVDNIGNDRGAASSRTLQPLSATLIDNYATRLPPRTVGVELRYAMGR
jgi:outer membrane receptor protein involved in Fe transport